MTYPLQENADGVFANRILRPEPEMQAIFTEIGLRTCGHGSFPLPAGLPCRRRQGKKSPATANFLFDAQPNLFGIARQIKKSANFVHGLFAYRLAERRGFEPLKPFRGLLAFQAGQFNHSCTFPRIKKKEPTIRPVDSLRRERDSNPRYSCPYTAFRVRPDRPLRHLSKIAAERGEAPPSGPVGSDVYHPFGAANINKISQIVLFHDKKVVRKRKFAPHAHRSVQYPRPARVYMNETGRLSKIIPTFVRKPFRY